MNQQIQEKIESLEKQISELKEQIKKEGNGSIYPPEDTPFWVINSAGLKVKNKFLEGWAEIFFDNGVAYLKESECDRQIILNKARVGRYLPHEGEDCWTPSPLFGAPARSSWMGTFGDWVFYHVGAVRKTQEETQDWIDEFLPYFKVERDGE